MPGVSAPVRRGGGLYDHLSLLGLGPMTGLETVRRIEEGLDISALDRFQELVGLPASTFSALLRIAPRTLARRRSQPVAKLTAEESDRLVRAARVFARALDLFDGDMAATKRWLTSPKVALGNYIPLDIAGTDAGAREIDTLIERIEYGVVI